MDFMELAKNRYSERFFDPRPVEQEKLDRILEAGRIVPTAWHFKRMPMEEFVTEL